MNRGALRGVSTVPPLSDARYQPPKDFFAPGGSTQRGFFPVGAYGEDFTMVADTPYFVPFSLSAPTTIDAFSVYVVTGAAGLTARFFVCTTIVGQPSELVPGTEVFLSSSTWSFGAKFATTSSPAAIPAGSYAATLIVSGGSPAVAGCRSLAPGVDPPSAPSASLRVPYGTTTGYTSYTASDTAANIILSWSAAPAPLGPRIGLRRAKVA